MFLNVGKFCKVVSISFFQCWHVFQKMLAFFSKLYSFWTVVMHFAMLRLVVFAELDMFRFGVPYKEHKRALISTANAHDYVHTAWTKDSSSISDLNDVYHCALFEVYGLAPDHDAACQLKLTWRYLTSKCLWYLLANSNCTKVSIWKSSIQLDQMKSFEQMIYRNWLVEF